MIWLSLKTETNADHSFGSEGRYSFHPRGGSGVAWACCYCTLKLRPIVGPTLRRSGCIWEVAHESIEMRFTNKKQDYKQKTWNFCRITESCVWKNSCIRAATQGVMNRTKRSTVWQKTRSHLLASAWRAGMCVSIWKILKVSVLLWLFSIVISKILPY